MGDQVSGLDTIDRVWSVAFEEAWASARAGNYGIGAAVVDPADDRIVARGRNRVAEQRTEPGLLAGNMTAHAEMNAFAALDRFNASGLHLYTTLEPCLMCASASMLLKVEHVDIAVADEFFAGLDDLWQAHPVTAGRRPGRTLLDSSGLLADFARLLPMVFTLRTFPDSAAARLARSTHPALADAVDRLLGDDAAMASWLALDVGHAVEFVSDLIDR